MNLIDLRGCLSAHKGAREDLPFGPDVLVYKVMNKMFALVSWQETPLRISLKCEPHHALVLRSIFDAIIPGYHLNKDHWNTVVLDESITEPLIKEMIDESYRLVVEGLTRSERKQLENLPDRYRT